MERARIEALLADLCQPPFDVGLTPDDVIDIVETGASVELYVLLPSHVPPPYDLGRLWCCVFMPRDGRLALEYTISTQVGQATEAELARGLAELREDAAQMAAPTRTAVARPRVGSSRARSLAPFDERAGARGLEQIIVLAPAPAIAHVDVDRAERALGTRLPSGYRTFVTTLGTPLVSLLFRVAAPDAITGQLEEWRARIGAYWFWGDAPLSQQRALECVRIADTLDGDELVFHPSEPDHFFVLPRHEERAIDCGRGLVPALLRFVAHRNSVPLREVRLWAGEPSAREEFSGARVRYDDALAGLRATKLFEIIGEDDDGATLVSERARVLVMLLGAPGEEGVDVTLSLGPDADADAFSRLRTELDDLGIIPVD